ncbi:ABC transporter permease [Kineosporia succinea]|uniref:Glycine betaine/proline transport system permease protein n=1 Tax=Kineosporia succinea TaxID=84632 RepID=A0ABT9P009_9ACTN|nr:ABC transporter permease subunit [Kineosporia succinea]MDP9826017.1 glycine betaine/proline transport system permease protein [Kineosporia succinea]
MTVLPLSRAAVTKPGRGRIIAAVLVAFVVLAAVFRGRDTLGLVPSDTTALHRRLNDLNHWVSSNRNESPIFLYFFNEIRAFVDALTTLFQNLISQPGFGRPVPVIGWLGVVAIFALVALAFAGVRVALLLAVGFVFIGMQGLWEESMDTLALTLSAVLLALVIGIPLGIWAGLNDRASAVVTPVLDFLQTMPTFVYLAPFTLLFLIGPASATLVTLVYALPPAVRYTAHGIRSVPRSSVEASESLGSTSFQRLTGVLLPMSRRTIVLGLNQTIMAALSMATVAALIDAPGLGKTILKSLQTLDVGVSFNAGLAIVVMAILLDRLTTAISRSKTRRPSRLRLPVLAVSGVLTVFAVYLSRTYLWAAEFPTTLGATDINIGNDIARISGNAAEWVTLHFSDLTGQLKDSTTTLLIDPVQTLLVESPWWLVAALVLSLAFLLGDLRTTVISAFCVAGLIGSGLWQDSMTTLAATLIATAATMLLGVVFGVWMARSRRADLAIRPVLDALQVMPPFVYLVPFLALFAASRFTAILAAVLYAAPVAIKVVADGITAVSATTVEAATASGSSAGQIIWKVQLPMARQALVLAANQGICYVLAMIVVGGLVGAGALGYDVVAGFSQGELFGKGLTAGFAIVILGILLNRITQAAAERRRGA